MDAKNLRDKLVGSDDERAVSPVIGVILMVAITVILAAVIATLVMDFGDSVDQETNAGANIEQNGNDVTVTWVSEGSADDVAVTGSCSNATGQSVGNVGGSVTITCTTGGETVNAVAMSSDTGNTTVATHTVE